MHIVHWTDNFLPLIGGAETFVRDLSLAQMKEGHRVTVFSSFMPGRPAEETFAGVEVLRRPFPDGIFMREPPKLGHLIRACAATRARLRPDLVHVHFTQIAAWFETLSRPSVSVPVILTAHSPLETVGTDPQLTRRILERADAVVAVSADVRAAIREEFLPDPASHIDLVLNGATLPSLPPAPVFSGPPTIVGVGRLVESKGFDVVLLALTLLPGVRFILAGDGPARAPLESLAARLGVADRVDFRGAIHPDTVPALMNEGDLIVMPSRWREPFGLVAVQAALMGRALVASRTGGIPEILRHGETGLLVPVNDPRALAQAVAGLFADPALNRRLGAAALIHAREHFSMERCAADYAAIYQRVAQSRTSALP